MFRQLLRDPRRLQMAFVAVMLLLATTLGWLGWRLIALERELEAQRIVDQRETATDLAVANLDRRLSDWRQRLEALLADGANTARPDVSAGCLVVRFDRQSVRASPANGLIYSPREIHTAAPDAAASRLIDAAAVERSNRRYDSALAIYSRLEQRGASVAAGMPAALDAKLGRITTYERAGNATGVQEEARRLSRDLESGSRRRSDCSRTVLQAQAH